MTNCNNFLGVYRLGCLNSVNQCKERRYQIHIYSTLVFLEKISVVVSHLLKFKLWVVSFFARYED